MRRRFTSLTPQDKKVWYAEEGNPYEASLESEHSSSQYGSELRLGDPNIPLAGTETVVLDGPCEDSSDLRTLEYFRPDLNREVENYTVTSQVQISGSG